MFLRDSNAQGTIEYLVIIAIVVVISLVVVGLFVTLMDSPSKEITDSSSQAGSVAVGGISVVEAVIDYDGESLIRLTNNSSDAITLTRITVGGEDNNFSEQLVGLDSKVFSLSSLNSNCPCVSGQKSVKCEVKIIYNTTSGNTHTEYKTINAQCVNDSVPVNPTIVVAPIVLISDCFDVGVSPIPICTLTDLNRMRENLDASYILMNNIDASETSTWNAGLGWEPIGNSTTPFAGNFDGNNYTITRLTINRPSQDYVGFFGAFRGDDINNVKLLNSNIIGQNNVGGIIGYVGGYGYLDYSSSISNSYYSGSVLGGNAVGGLIGVSEYFWITINNSHNSGNVSGSSNVGGILGMFTGFVDETLEVYIENSSNSGNITGTGNSVGGLIGHSDSMHLALVESSFNSGDVLGTLGAAGGLIGRVRESISINNSYNSGSVSGEIYVGGITGLFTGDESCFFEKSYNSGEVSASTHFAGGIIGYATSCYVIESYNLGEVSGINNIRGIMGYVLSELSIKNYWDTYSTNTNNCYIYPAGDSNTGCTPTNNEVALYYGANGIPFDEELNWSTDNWVPVDGGNPILIWQTE